MPVKLIGSRGELELRERMGGKSMMNMAVLMLLLGVTVVTAAMSHDYGDALTKSILFFEGQRSGKLPSNQRMNWRKDSALRDGSDIGVSGYVFPCIFKHAVHKFAQWTYKLTSDLLLYMLDLLNFYAVNFFYVNLLNIIPYFFYF
jgi:hypothetical protein